VGRGRQLLDLSQEFLLQVDSNSHASKHTL
jgi:hypothetical protein